MLHETIDYKAHVINIHYDEHAESPDSWGNDDVFLVYDHRQFFVERNGFNPDDIFETMQAGKKTYDGYWFFPVYAYIHSGVSLSLGRTGYPFNCPWDTSFKGFALVKREKGWSYTEEKARKIALSIVEEWNDYLSGQVYGFVAETQDGEHIDSCWGFYGDEGMDEAISQAKGAIDWHIADQKKSHFEQLKTWIKNRVPLQYRSPLQLSF